MSFIPGGSGGGGGGSGSPASAAFEQGVRAGNGLVTITFTLPSAPSAPAAAIAVVGVTPRFTG